MTNKEIAGQLRQLAQLDIDAVHAYDQAIGAIDVLGIKDQLTQFKLDHQRHITELSQEIQKLGETPPAYSRDFKGFLIQGFTAARALLGTEGALKAMRDNEKLTNSVYAQAMAKPFPEQLLGLIKKNYADEQRHLSSIEQTLSTRAWEGAGARG